MKSGPARVVVAAAVASLVFTAASCGYAKEARRGAPSQGGVARVGLLLPESKTTRYEQFDRPLIEARIRSLAPDATIDYFNANQDATLQQTQVDTALTKDDEVLILDPVDAKAIQSSVQKAHDDGVKVVAYDRLAQGPIDGYVSFDNIKVGQLQGKALVEAVGANASSGKIIMINGSPTDPNAAQFRAGAHSEIDGRLTIGKEYDTPQWDPATANEETAAAISALGAQSIVGVYCANDGMAAGVATALHAAGLTVPLTGQDAALDAVQRIIAGTQTMSIYKPFKPEADAAAQMAVMLGQGKPLGYPVAPTTATNGSGHTAPANLITPIVLTKENVRSTVVADGLYTVNQICTSDYAAACAAVGLR